MVQARWCAGCQALAQAAPKEMLRMMRPVLEEALEAKWQEKERASIYVACEIVAGFLHSGVCFEAQGAD